MPMWLTRENRKLARSGGKGPHPILSEARLLAMAEARKRGPLTLRQQIELQVINRQLAEFKGT